MTNTLRRDLFLSLNIGQCSKRVIYLCISCIKNTFDCLFVIKGKRVIICCLDIIKHQTTSFCSIKDVLVYIRRAKIYTLLLNTLTCLSLILSCSLEATTSHLATLFAHQVIHNQQLRLPFALYTVISSLCSRWECVFHSTVLIKALFYSFLSTLIIAIHHFQWRLWCRY